MMMIKIMLHTCNASHTDNQLLWAPEILQPTLPSFAFAQMPCHRTCLSLPGQSKFIVIIINIMMLFMQSYHFHVCALLTQTLPSLHGNGVPAGHLATEHRTKQFLAQHIPATAHQMRRRRRRWWWWWWSRRTSTLWEAVMNEFVHLLAWSRGRA